MVMGFFGQKKRIEKLKLEVRDSFEGVKKDFKKVSEWISHLNSKEKNQEEVLKDFKEDLSSLKLDIEEIKDFISFFGSQLSKQQTTHTIKQTALRNVQTPVQTAVQTSILDNLTVMERAIVWSLLNSDLKLSYEDLAAMLGKGKSTIRGQINAIKQKSEGLIMEQISENGKKRVYIPEEIKQIVIKSVKVRVKRKEKKKIPEEL